VEAARRYLTLRACCLHATIWPIGRTGLQMTSTSDRAAPASVVAVRGAREHLHALADRAALQGLALVGTAVLTGPPPGPRDMRDLAAAGLAFSRALDPRRDRWRDRVLAAAETAGCDGVARRAVFAAVGGHARCAEIDSLIADLVTDGLLQQAQGPVTGGRRATIVRRETNAACSLSSLGR
jgi:hypothetical protein